MVKTDSIDKWISEEGPAAIIAREYLVPVMGGDSVVFPPTFAPVKGSSEKKSEYVIDQLRTNKVCLLDSVGSQANRMEPMFKRPPFNELVPEVVIDAKGHKINLLDAGHRAADAIVRHSELGDEIGKAFKALKENGDALPLARLAPTSFVFGAWDSRDTQAKIPRIISSTIMAYDVEPLSRSAQYIPPLDYKEAGILDDAGIDPESKTAGELGLSHVPSPNALGGVVVHGDIRRECILNLTAIRAMGTTDDAGTLKLRRYLLGLALVAFTAPTEMNLRQGCLLVRNPDRKPDWKIVRHDGTSEAFQLTHKEALEFAHAAAKDFSIAEPRTVAFDTKRLKNTVAKAKRGKGKGGKETTQPTGDEAAE